MTLQELYKLLSKELDIPIWYCEAEQEQLPYIVYQDLSTSYTYASGRPYVETINLELIHFAKKGENPTLEQLKQVLHNNKIMFSINTVFDHESKNIINQFMLTISADMEMIYEDN